MDFTNDKKTLSSGDEFMFGDALLVCPVYEYGARSRKVYLPEGRWYDWYSGAAIEGGREIIADAPYDRIPLFARAGQIVPEGADIQYTAQDDGRTLTLKIFSGKDAVYSLYEDDGLTYGYERGEYCRYPMVWNDEASTLTIKAREGSFKGMAPAKTVNVEVISPDGIRRKSAVYTGEEIFVTL